MHSSHTAGRTVAVLGSTGSIGTATLRVVEGLGGPDAGWTVTALTAHGRVDLLTEQVERFRPAVAVVTSGEPDPALRKRMEAVGTRVRVGAQAMTDVAADPGSDTVVAAVVGSAGLPAVFAAARAGKRIALANKESLVVAGRLVMATARRCGATILPVDSEHSAVHQAMASGRREEIRRVILTASGGPFRTTPAPDMEHASAEQALRHPTWTMGGKITIDSATLMNKAFEVIEAHHLFSLPGHQIEVVVHPQSIVHSMVEFVDGSTLAQLGPQDMCLPIQYALTWPDRRACPAGKRMDWTIASSLTFEPPDAQRFPALGMAYEVIAALEGGSDESDTTLGAAMNAANEVAVQAFLAGRVRFGAISRTVRTVMDATPIRPAPDLESLLAADQQARAHAAALVGAEQR